MSSPDFSLPAGDTSPVTPYTLRDPSLPDGQVGPPVDLTTASTVVIRYQPKNRSIAMVQRTATVVGDPTLGQIQVDWKNTGGALTAGNYIARFVVTFADGSVRSWPNSDRNASSGLDANGDDDDNTFFWLQVAPGFT